MSYYLIPLNISENVTDQEVSVNINNKQYILYFQQNSVINTACVSCYSINKDIIYFASLICSFGSYVNLFDNGFPYLLQFVPNNVFFNTKIHMSDLNNNVILYFRDRTDIM